jgi:uncharacterized protein involved in outer membrane biogenesis
MTPSSRARWRKAAWPLGVLAVLVLAVIGCEVAGWPFLKAPAQQQLSQRLNRDVEFGERFRLKLFGSIRVDTSGLRVGPPRDLPANSPLGGDLVNATDAHLELPYGTVIDLLRERENEAPPRITSLRFGQVDAALKRQADGRANWTLTTPRRDPSKQAMDMPVVDELVLDKGHIVYDDGVLKTFVDARVSTGEGAHVVEGRKTPGLVVEGKGRHEERPFDFRVTSAGVLPLVARDHSTVVPITVRLNAGDSKFSFDGTGTDIIGFHAMDGAAALSGPSLAKVGDALGLTLPTTEPFDLKGRLSKSGQVWALKNAALNVGDSRLGGQFTYDRRPQVPLLSGELTGSHFDLADLLPAFGAPRPGSGNPKPPAGRVLPQREFDIPSLRQMNADVRVRLQRAELGAIFRQPLAPLQGDLSLQGGVLKLNNLVARAAGGEVKGHLGLDGTQPRPLWTIDVRWGGIELEQWLRPRNKTAKDVKPSGEKPGYISGRLGGHADLKGRGKSTAQLIGSLSGTLQAWIRKGSISHLVVEGAGIDIFEALGVLIKGDDRLPLHCAAVKAKMGDGIVVPEVGLVDTDDSTVFVSGSASLADEKLDLLLVTKPKDVSPITLRSPVRVEGTFSAPKVRLDSKQLATKAGLAAVLASIHPLASLVALFDPGDKEHAGGCERALQQLRDADGPKGTRDARAPKPADLPASARASATPPTRHATGPQPHPDQVNK